MADQRPRAPGMTYAALSLVLLALIALLALTARTPPPPSIAEFAPQSVDNIADAPTDQTASSGRGSGGTGDGGGLDATPTPPPPLDVPRVRKCVGDPPRQIEDPQSPPCVPYWTGDNGGATWEGITRDTIKIAVADNDHLPDGLVEGLEQFFNRRFEFYGRRLVTDVYTPVTGDGQGSPAAQQADATKAHEEVRAFAAVEYGIDAAGGDRSGYYDRLASYGISSFNWTPSYSRPGDARSRTPHQWQHFADLPTQQQHLGALICRSLTGRRAEYGGPDVAAKPRKFGLITERAKDNNPTYPDTSTLESALKACGASMGPVIQAPNFDSVASRNAIISMQTAGVTSIIFIGDGGNIGTLYMNGAKSQGYTPEWVFTDFFNMNNDFFVHSLWPSDQAIHAFGITFNNKFNEASQMPWKWAMREANPNWNDPYDWSHRYYVAYLQMSSAIQMAGPKLTPDAMWNAMRRTRFPNPGAGAAPYYQANIDYSSGDPWMQRDATLVWWSPAVRSWVDGLLGTWCYAQLGHRYTMQTYPVTDTGLFQLPCH